MWDIPPRLWWCTNRTDLTTHNKGFLLVDSLIHRKRQVNAAIRTIADCTLLVYYDLE